MCLVFQYKDTDSGTVLRHMLMKEANIASSCPVDAGPDPFASVAGGR